MSGKTPCQDKNYVNQSHYDLNKHEFDYNDKKRVEYENLDFLQSVRTPQKKELSKPQLLSNNYDNLDRNYSEFIINFYFITYLKLLVFY